MTAEFRTFGRSDRLRQNGLINMLKYLLARLFFDRQTEADRKYFPDRSGKRESAFFAARKKQSNKARRKTAGAGRREKTGVKR